MKCSRLMSFAATMLLAGCSSNKSWPQSDAQLDAPQSDIARTDGLSPIDAPPGCSPFGKACLIGAECCSGVCTDKACAAAKCAAVGEACKLAIDCCNLNCSGTTCAAAACIADGESCATGGTPCCSTKCVNNACEPLNPSCKTAGNPCPNGATDCCSKICTDGKCASPAQVSFCTQTGDICMQNNECCTGVCNGATATTAGTCAAITTSCNVDGVVCTGCTGCCSSFCAPYGLSGPYICQPASGCHVRGDLCHVDSDCCGGDATQIGIIPGAGLVRCIADPNYPQIGTCSEPNPNNCPSGKDCGNNCVPEGDVCHYKGNGGCASNAIQNDCCGAPGNKGMCKLDKLGIPRCYGLTACVSAGGACASAADCCDNLPCVPDSTGHLKCSSASCVPEAGVCTTTADCCTGLLCLVPPGSLQGTCTSPQPQPPPPSDGGVRDRSTTDGTTKADQYVAPPCALYGQSCSTTVSCCANQGHCLTPAAQTCPAGETDCTCYTLF